jgi:hypothetical protein
MLKDMNGTIHSLWINKSKLEDIIYGLEKRKSIVFIPDTIYEHINNLDDLKIDKDCVINTKNEKKSIQEYLNADILYLIIPKNYDITIPVSLYEKVSGKPVFYYQLLSITTDTVHFVE